MSLNTRSRLGLTTSEAARHLGVSLSTIRRWSDLGHLRGYRTPGGQRRFSREQLDEFMASLEGADTAPRRVDDVPARFGETEFRAAFEPAPAGEEHPRFEKAGAPDDAS